MGAPALHPSARKRLAALCGMLGSTHDGERANAAALADRMVRDLGTTWAALLCGGDVAERAPSPAPAAVRPDDHRAIARWCLDRRGLLTKWEAGFLADLAAWTGRPTPKQSATLAAIVNKLADAPVGAQGRRA